MCDLARGHLLALQKIDNFDTYEYFNLGQGKGYSVLEIVKCFMSVNKVLLPYSIKDKRPGDLEIVYCDTKKSKNLLEFETKLDINIMCKDSWNFQNSY